MYFSQEAEDLHWRGGSKMDVVWISIGLALLMLVALWFLLPVLV
jgi:hypothetical protein